ncbi:MAG: DNA polymerase III subunit [bacterium]|nr:DNA polymerase III subunit [bacterium]
MMANSPLTHIPNPDHPWPVFGHDWAVQHLRQSLRHNRVRHAYLFTGAQSIGKNTLAHTFAMALNCLAEDVNARPCGVCRSCKLIQSGNHPDLLYSELDPSTGTLKIETLRSLMSRIAMKPYEGRYRIAILQDFDNARPQAQDALLKTLEEPPPYVVLILLASSLETVLSTIISRSQVLPLRPVSVQNCEDVLVTRYGSEMEKATLLARLSGGRIGWAIDAAQNPETLDQRGQALDLLETALKSNRAVRFKLAEDLGRDKRSLQTLLEVWLTYWRDLLLLAEESPIKPCNSDREIQMQQLLYLMDAEEALRATKATQATLDMLPRNVNTRLALEVMFLDYPNLVR